MKRKQQYSGQEPPLKKQRKLKDPVIERVYLNEDKTSWVDSFNLPDNIMISEDEMNELWEMHPTEFKKLRIFNKEYDTPRWFQSYGQSYKFSGHEYPALPIPEIIQKYLDYANSLPQYHGTSNAKFNMCLINWYEDGNHSIGYHSDDETQIVKNKEGECEIFSISFGQTRLFKLQSKDKTDTKEFNLSNGSVIVMGGKTQSTHKHSIPKISGKKALTYGNRINLTFRKFKEEEKEKRPCINCDKIDCTDWKCEAGIYYTVRCRNNHEFSPFKSKSGKVFWKSSECKGFFSHDYIDKVGPYDDDERVIKCDNNK